MVLRQTLFYLCFLLAATKNVESFFLPKAQSLITTTSGGINNIIQSQTALSVIMGGYGTDLPDIPTRFLENQENILENVNERAISLFAQFQGSAGFEEIVASQDNIAQFASILKDKSENAQDIIMGGSSTTLSAIPDSVLDSVGEKIGIVGKLDGDIVSTAAATASAAISVNDAFENSQVGYEPTSSISMEEISGTVDQLSSSIALSGDTVAISGAESSNKVVALVEKTILSFDDIAAKSGDSLEDTAKQLSDQLYQSFGSIDSAQASIKGAPQFIAQQSDAALQGALDEANRVFESGTSKLLEKGSQTLQSAKETPVKVVLKNIEDAMKVILKSMDGLLEGFSGSSFSGHVEYFKASLAGAFGDFTSKFDHMIHDFGKVNLQQVVKFVLQEVILFVQALTKIFMTLLDALSSSFTGDTLSGHFQHLQTSLYGAISDSSQLLTSAVTDIGKINGEEIFHLLLSFVTFVTKIIFQLFSALVVVLSGQGIDEWTLQTVGAVEEGLKEVSLQLSDTAIGVAESSLADLGALMIQLLESISALVIEGLQGLGIAMQASGPLAGALATDAFQSVNDGVSMMTANL
jgi:hypothetical protein